MKTDFIPVDYDYFDFKGRNYVKIIGRNSSGKRVCVIDTCPVYLWAILKDKTDKKKIDSLIKKIEKIELDIKGRKTKVERVELHDKNFLGKPVKALKIFATNYKDLHDVADKMGLPEIEKRRGYDLGYTTHYIIEKKIIPLSWYEVEGEVLNNSQEFGGIDSSLEVDLCIKLEKVKEIPEKEFIPKVLAYDIETEDIQLGKGEILMVSLVSDGFKKVITHKKAHKTKDYVEYVKDEAELIEKFIEYVKKFSPDFLVGYFSDGFDLPYIKARAEKYNIKLNLGIDGSQPKFHRGAVLTGKINGIVHIDLLKFIQTAYSQYMQSETLSLNDIAQEFLGDRKKDFEFKHSSEMRGGEWENYFEYNLHDSVLTYNLFQKFWHDLIEFTKVMQEPIFDVSRNGMSRNVEEFIIHNLNKFNEIPEKRPSYEEIGKRREIGKYEGGFVLEPIPGLYTNLAVFDFTSSYGSVIVTYNLSKSTLLEKPEKNSYDIEALGKKAYFTKKPGFFPEMLRDIIEKRKKYKQELNKKPDAENKAQSSSLFSAKKRSDSNDLSYVIKKARSNAFKLLANAAYGYQGFFGARYYCIEAAAATAAFARKAIKDSIENINKAGYKTIYSDTDSIAFLLQEKTKKQTQDFLKKLNHQLPGIMELELEGFFKRGLWVTTRAGVSGAKKKYALIDEKNKLKIRGFETVRRDWCRLARNLQNEVIKEILEDGDEKRALKRIKETIKKIKERKIDKKMIIIKTQLKKQLSEYKAISPHVIAARKMIEKKIPIDQGDLIEYYIAETQGKNKLVREKVKLPDEKGEYNIEYYLERQVLPAVENILQVFNINIKEIIDGRKQTTLRDF